MEILDYPVIKKRLESISPVVLYQNNKRLNVIICLDDNPEKELSNVLNKLIEDVSLEDGYYSLRRIFQYLFARDPKIIVHKIISTINTKLMSIHETITGTDGEIEDINLCMYLQIYKSYKDFCDKMYVLIKCFQEYLTKRNVRIGIRKNFDILSIIQNSMFYDVVIGNKEKNILEMVTTNLGKIDTRNIAKLIDYIESIKKLLLVKDFIKTKNHDLDVIIKNIMNRQDVMDMMCKYIDKLLKVLNDMENFQHIGNEMEPLSIKSIEDEIACNILRIADIIFRYSNNLTYQYYIKYMQPRIVSNNYKNLEFEIGIITKYYRIIGEKSSKRLLNIIHDVFRNVKMIKQLKTIIPSIILNKHLNFSSNIVPDIKPIILTKNVWEICNISEINPNYPSEIGLLLEIIKGAYEEMHQQKYTIQWQPTMGYARFSAKLGNREIKIGCNILQAIALCYLNNKTTTTYIEFSNDTRISKKISKKIFQSLFEENIICALNSEPVSNIYIYKVNTENYTGENEIEIHNTFLNTFIKESKTIS